MVLNYATLFRDDERERPEGKDSMTPEGRKEQKMLAQVKFRRTLTHPDRCDNVDMELDRFQPPSGPVRDLRG